MARGEICPLVPTQTPYRLAVVTVLVIAISSGIGFGASSAVHHRFAAKVVARVPAGGTLLSVACPAQRHCEAVGDDETFSGPRKELAEWTGARWRVQLVRGNKHATGDLLSAISCPTTRACVAVGTNYLNSGVAVPLAQIFSRSHWRVVPIPAPPAGRGTGSRLTGVSCLSARDCFAVGFNQLRSGAATLAERWNGTRWRIQPTPNVARARSSLLTRVSCASVRACTAIGTLVTSSGTQSGFAERWSGTRWQIQATATIKSAFGHVLTGISCPAVRFCVAVGGYVSADRTLAETWYGIKWRVHPTPSPARELTSSLVDVSCRSPGRCTAIGFSNPDSHRYATLIEGWNGSGWRIQASPNRSRISDLYSVSCPAPRSCIAVGDYSTQLGLRRTLVETWNGASWRIAP